uniref:Tubulin--tyrosine ligase-like protein 9 n=1 Tax=Macrostomum lignano TaxID=282301 RepID=A0A1I8GW35_9PLAT
MPINQRDRQRKLPPTGTVRFKSSLNNTILDVMRSFGWQEVTAENGEFDFYWIDVTLMKELFDRGFLDEHVRISHFRNHYELCKKNLMVKNLKRMRKKVAKESGREEAAKYDFIPCTFELPISVQEDIAVRKSPSSLRFECIARFADALRRAQSSSAVAGLSRLSTQIASSVPQLVSNHTNLEGIESPTTALQSEYHMFVEEFKKSPGTTWIMKPAGKAQGKGIFLFRKIRDIEAWKKSSEYLPGPPDPNKEVPETYVVSRYIDNPYLVGGRKFDLRVYVLVMSVYLYRDGFARFSNTRYTSDSIDDTYVHLTNVAVQKTAPDYDPDKGAKWSIIKLREYLTAKHGVERVEQVFRDMDNIFLKSLQSVQKIMINDKHCFELYGYDILLDSDLQPWLIEVNASPSLTASSKE